jgi:uncharacterized membrane protein YkvA (DUF1232 family)
MLRSHHGGSDARRSLRRDSWARRDWPGRRQTLRQRPPKILGGVPQAARYIPFADDLVAAYFCALDPATPHRVRAVLLGALAYFILPFDAIPDFIAGIGYSDDLTVLIAAIALVRSHITPAHRQAAKKALADEDA